MCSSDNVESPYIRLNADSMPNVSYIGFGTFSGSYNSGNFTNLIE